MGVVHGTVVARSRHLAVNSKEAARVFPIKKRKPQGRGSFTKWTRVVAFMAPAPHNHGLENCRSTCLLNSGPLADTSPTYL